MSSNTSLDMDDLSIEEKIEKINLLRELIHLKENTGTGFSSQNTKQKKNIISGTVMSVIFFGCFTLVIAVSFYSFRMLYLAVQKKFPSPHSELVGDVGRHGGYVNTAQTNCEKDWQKNTTNECEDSSKAHDCRLQQHRSYVKVECVDICIGNQ
ncbi:Hypothetical protein CINCED_3A004374 [Cinara cedri]|uniref:Uncharacterized protein n=1 Tax=Cinara cedri TaxID=506608 RepID=A0A5E4MN81_9HEMI|nr:Hypothetical protein CINCED_3A004374 [Cinara cedri]